MNIIKKNCKNDMMNVEFAIVIPTYNRFEKLKTAINSVICQTYGVWQIIVVDDCSDMICSKQIQEFIYQMTNKNIKYFRLQENKGHCYARNYGVQQVNNPNCWIKYLDDDNVLLPNCLKDLTNYITKHNSTNVITTSYIQKNDDGEKVVTTNYLKQSVFDGSLDTCAICHTKKLFEIIGGWDERLYKMADDDFFFKYITRGQYGYVDSVGAIYYNLYSDDRVTNKYCNCECCFIISTKYPYFYNNKCLIISDNCDNIYQENYDIESFMPFDVSDKVKKGYAHIIKYDNKDKLNDIFQYYYNTKLPTFKFGNSLFIKGI